MERTVVSLQSLRVLLNLELATLENCEGLEVGNIEVDPVPDRNGCNWRVTSYTGLMLRETCASLAAAVISALSWRYNVGRK
jgi:hypothetical protein